MPEPFTAEHFRLWALELVLDNGEPWVVEPFFLEFVDDYFSGVPEAWLIVPEGNSKTTSLAGLAVYLLEHRTTASIPWAASSRDQAEIGYRQAEGFVRRSLRLKDFLKCQDGLRRIKNLRDNGRIQIFAADDGHADGIIPTDAFLDELHRHKDLRLYRIWRGKLGKRNAQISTISTAGEPGSEFEEVRELIRQSVPVVARGPGFVRCRSDAIALHEYAVAENGDVENMQVVKDANPFTGITVESLAAKRGTPTMTLAHWRRFVCNLPTRVDEAAVTEAEWFAAKTDEQIPNGQSVAVGLDLGWKYDTTAIVPIWIKNKEFRLFGPAVVLEPPMNGEMLDSRDIERALIQLHERNPIELVVMDPNRGEQMAQWIEQEFGCPVVERQQTIPLMALDYSRFMEALREGWLKHAGDEPLTRHVLNAIAKVLPRGDIIFERPVKSRKHKTEQRRRVIDALDAAAMVHSTVMAQETEPEPFFQFA